MLCNVMLSCGMLCNVVLCYVMSCNTILRYIILYYVEQCDAKTRQLFLFPLSNGYCNLSSGQVLTHTGLQLTNAINWE